VVKQKRIPMNKTTLWIVLSGFFFFLHLWTFKYAAKNTTISNGMIIFATNPVWVSIGAILFFKEKLAKRLYLSYALAFVSVYLLVGAQFKLQSDSDWGDLSALVSAILYAFYMLTGKKARQHFDNTSYAFIQYSVCALCFAMCIGVTGAPVTGYDSVSWFAVAGLVLLPTFFGHLSMTYLVHHMNLSLMTCGKLAEPIMATVIAWFVFGENLNPNAPYAFALTATSVAILFAPQLDLVLKRAKKN
jgi:drug/metabolite transporter (DMT)-like permease